MVTPTVSDTEQNPTHHVTLEELDGSNKIGLMVVNSSGDLDPQLVTRSNYPRTVTQIQQGGGEYDDLTLPYKSIVQQDWSGGRGQLIFEDDKTRFMESYRVSTDQAGQITLGGQETWTDLAGKVLREIHMPGTESKSWVALHTTTRYYAVSFVPGANYSAQYLGVWLRKNGSPGTVTLALRADSAGSPSTINLIGGGFTTATFERSDDVSVMVIKNWLSQQALTNGTTYWVVVYGASTDDSTNYWEVLTDDSLAGKQAQTDTAWSASTSSPYYILLDNTQIQNGRYFEYKRGMYFVTQPEDGSASGVYLNGDRGVADSNSGDLSKLQDATKAWTADEHIGRIALIVSGTGSGEAQPWREITDNDATSLTVSPNWQTTHDTTTEYVILGANDWQLVQTLSFYAKDVAVAGELVYFAHGSDGITRYQWYNNSGTETERTAAERSAYEADRLLSVKHPEDAQHSLYGAYNSHAQHGVAIFRATVPGKWGNLYTDLGEIASTDLPWDETLHLNGSSSNVLGDLGTKFTATTTGATQILGTIGIDPTDLRRGTAIGLWIKPDDDAAASRYQVRMNDVPFRESFPAPDYLMVQRPKQPVPATKVLLFKPDDQVSALSVQHYGISGDTYTDEKRIYDGQDDTNEAVTMTTTDRFFVGNDKRFDRVRFLFGSTKNAVGSVTTTIYYFDGSAYTSLTLDTDGTDTGSSTPWATNGNYEFKMPDDWQKSIVNSVEGYWLRIKFGTNLTANVNILQIKVWDSNTGEFQDLFHTYDERSPGEQLITITTTDELYIGHSSHFDRIGVDMGSTPNSVSATVSAKASKNALGAVVVQNDGTSSAGATLATSGNIDIEVEESDHEQITVNGVSAYWIVLTFSANLTAQIGVDNFYIQKRNSFEFINIQNIQDIDQSDEHTLRTDDYLYIGHARRFKRVKFWLLDTLVNDNAATVTYEVYSNSGGAFSDANITSDGTVSTGKPLAQDGTIVLSDPVLNADDAWALTTINGIESYWFRLSFSADLDAVGFDRVHLDYDSDKISINLPALTGGVWNWAEATIAPSQELDQQYSNIQYVQLFVTDDTGFSNPYTVELTGGIRLLKTAPFYTPLNTTRVTNLVQYGRLRRNPWILTERGVYEIQTEFEDQIVQIPVAGIDALVSESNGIAAVHNDVYLYFNLSGRVQRYFEGSLENIGFDTDEGLPDDRQGDVTDLEGYPGRVFAATDAGDSGYSTVMVRRGSGWHELYRAPKGYRISNMQVQVIPGDSLDRLWITVGSMCVWIPLPSKNFNPLRDSNYTYTHEGYYITGYMTAGFQDIQKLYRALKIFSKNLSATEYLQVEYQVDQDELTDTWTALPTLFTTSPSQEVKTATNYVVANRIRFRVRLFSLDATVSPVVNVTILDTLVRFPAKRTITFQFLASDFPPSLWDDEQVRVETRVAQLETWNNNPTPLLASFLYSPFDGLEMVVETIGLRPLKVDWEDQKEIMIGELTLLEI